MKAVSVQIKSVKSGSQHDDECLSCELERILSPKMGRKKKKKKRNKQSPIPFPVRGNCVFDVKPPHLSGHQSHENRKEGKEGLSHSSFLQYIFTWTGKNSNNQVPHTPDNHQARLGGLKAMACQRAELVQSK